MPFQIHITLMFLFLIIRVLIGVNILCTIILYGPTQYMRREARLRVIGGSYGKSLWVEVVRMECPFKFTLHLCSSFLLLGF